MRMLAKIETLCGELRVVGLACKISMTMCVKRTGFVTDTILKAAKAVF